MPRLLRIVLTFLSQPLNWVPSKSYIGAFSQHLSQRPLHNLSGASGSTWLPLWLCCSKE